MPSESSPLPPLSVRVNQLFRTFHSRSQPEQSVTDVAKSVSHLIRRNVEDVEIIRLRQGGHDDGTGADDLISGVAEHFSVPAIYLGAEPHVVAIIDRDLRLLAVARDAGVTHLELRGANVDSGKLAAALSQLAEIDERR
ncbi:hypothetical protein [Nocardia sp. XZ_19_231]|uniref:hypothetical protein n=1 Tax=Nocardia sp. XZ_19_231 TaxID=2769252 RepID=UPI00188EACBF|nr:hypothetical protein [Nocardia sp. XZ_19_231]